MRICLSPKLHGKYFKWIMNSQYWPSGISSHMNTHCVLHCHSLSIVGLPFRLKTPLREHHLPCVWQKHPCKTHRSNPKSPPKHEINSLQNWWTRSISMSPWKCLFFFPLKWREPFLTSNTCIKWSVEILVQRETALGLQGLFKFCCSWRMHPPA